MLLTVCFISSIFDFYWFYSSCKISENFPFSKMSERFNLLFYPEESSICSINKQPIPLFLRQCGTIIFSSKENRVAFQNLSLHLYLSNIFEIENMYVVLS